MDPAPILKSLSQSTSATTCALGLSDFIHTCMHGLQLASSMQSMPRSSSPCMAFNRYASCSPEPVCSVWSITCLEARMLMCHSMTCPWCTMALHRTAHHFAAPLIHARHCTMLHVITYMALLPCTTRITLWHLPLHSPVQRHAASCIITQHQHMLVHSEACHHIPVSAGTCQCMLAHVSTSPCEPSHGSVLFFSSSLHAGGDVCRCMLCIDILWLRYIPSIYHTEQCGVQYTWSVVSCSMHQAVCYVARTK